MAYNNVVFWNVQELKAQAANNATILAFGDSWFWYPKFGGSLINSIGDLVKPKGKKILVVGNNGLEAYDFVKGKYKGRTRETLRLYGDSAEAVLLSMGGNDFAGFSDLRPLLNDDCSNATSAQDCFKRGTVDDSGTLTWLMDRTFQNYAALLYAIGERCPASAKVFVHNYDYPVPSGVGVGGEGWIKPALVDAKVPAVLHQEVTRFLIDAFTGVLDKLHSGLPNRIVVIDGRGTLTANQWDNELHPTAAGFKKLVDDKWKPALAAIQLA